MATACYNRHVLAFSEEEKRKRERVTPQLWIGATFLFSSFGVCKEARAAALHLKESSRDTEQAPLQPRREKGERQAASEEQKRYQRKDPEEDRKSRRGEGGRAGSPIGVAGGREPRRALQECGARGSFPKDPGGKRLPAGRRHLPGPRGRREEAGKEFRAAVAEAWCPLSYTAAASSNGTEPPSRPAGGETALPDAPPGRLQAPPSPSFLSASRKRICLPPRRGSASLPFFLQIGGEEPSATSLPGCWGAGGERTEGERRPARLHALLLERSRCGRRAVVICARGSAIGFGNVSTLQPLVFPARKCSACFAGGGGEDYLSAERIATSVKDARPIRKSLAKQKARPAFAHAHCFCFCFASGETRFARLLNNAKSCSDLPLRGWGD